MKLEIEVPDGFVAGKLVFAAQVEDGIVLDSIDVRTSRKIRIKKSQLEIKETERRIPWEAD